MAHFKIHEDFAEKENHANANQKNLSSVTTGLSSQNQSNKNLLLLKQKQNVQQQHLTGAISKDPIKRSTFANLNNVVSSQQQQINQQQIQNGKTVFRDTKIDENYNAQIVKHQTKSFGITNENVVINKTNTAIPVEQFKYFSVYEDSKIAVQTKLDNESSLIQIKREEKEEILENKKISTFLDETVSSANLSMTSAIRDPLRDITLKDDSILQTPMSVSDAILSPMSVDRSNILQIIDSERVKKPPPRNYREKFFEVEEYQQSILEYFRELELKHRPKSAYMNRQNDIDYSMRTILIDWLVEVSEEYRLNTETLFLAVSYIDRFLSQMSVVRGKLQLVGTSAMFIAAKYEEIYPPDVSEFVFITDDTYTKSQVLRMEQIILKILSFDMSSPTSYVFVNSYAVLYNLPDQVKFLATYLCELALLEGDPYLQYLPSQISSAALALARYSLDMPMWDDELKQITTFELKDLSHIICHLSKTHNTSSKLQQQAIQEKYKHNKYEEVSKIDPADVNSDNIDDIINDQIQYMQFKSDSKISDLKLVTPKKCSNNNNNVKDEMISSIMSI